MYKAALISFIHRIENYNPYTNAIGFARSLLAFGTLLTLIFNRTDAIFPPIIASKFKSEIFIDKINAFLIFGPGNIFYAKILVIVLLIWIIVGYFPQINCLIHWWITYSFFNICLLGDGGDQIAAILCLLLIPIGVLDPRINHWQSIKKPLNDYINILSYSLILLIQIQVAVIYFHASIGKLSVSEWVDGTAVYYWFNHNIYGGTVWFKHLFGPLLNNPYIVFALTWGAMLLELIIFTGMFMSRKGRLLLLPLGLLFHFIILMILGLVSFFFSMAAALFLFLYPLNKNITDYRHILSNAYNE